MGNKTTLEGTPATEDKGQTFIFSISADIQKQEKDKILALIEKAKADILPAEYEDIRTNRILAYQYSLTELETESPHLLARRAFTSFVGSLPAGLLGTGNIFIALTETGYITTIKDLRVKTADKGNFPNNWAGFKTLYGYTGTAEAICETLVGQGKLEYTDKGDSAYKRLQDKTGAKTGDELNQILIGFGVKTNIEK
ncbi:hypothetical protein KJ782_06900 [Patescibacteria group bacterium]|nr:hypothetical protein [Patescibacteria group bacterium]